ncbi:MAG: hypothetical protein LBJ94_02840 [Puniceicoccales bacterium]|jgi:hypothetical protein|nr:hypothetical protein [Puniceicoccales bacterium]
MSITATKTTTAETATKVNFTTGVGKSEKAQGIFGGRQFGVGKPSEAIKKMVAGGKVGGKSLEGRGDSGPKEPAASDAKAASE